MLVILVVRDIYLRFDCVCFLEVPVITLDYGTVVWLDNSHHYSMTYEIVYTIIICYILIILAND